MLLSYPSDIALESRSSQPVGPTPPVQPQACSPRAAEFAICDETIEVTFHDQKPFLGFEDPQNQTPEAVARTAPMAGIVYDLVLLWYAARVQQGLATGWLVRPWYRSKTTPSFLDMLTAVRQESWRLYFCDPPLPGPATQKPAHSWANDLLATA
jgi:hypothetical protein